jgi:hypothetical protein
MKEKKKRKGEREYLESRHSNSYISVLHRWICLVFGYIMVLTTL